jgi:hypothetical protein
MFLTTTALINCVVCGISSPDGVCPRTASHLVVAKQARDAVRAAGMERVS